RDLNGFRERSRRHDQTVCADYQLTAARTDDGRAVLWVLWNAPFESSAADDGARSTDRPGCAPTLIGKRALRSSQINRRCRVSALACGGAGEKHEREHDALAKHRD